MATNYPTWDTFAGHGEPVSGYYWGCESGGPQWSSTEEYGWYFTSNQGHSVVVTREDGCHRVTIPKHKSFWWSSAVPSIEWWQERKAKRRHEIADRDEMRAITEGRPDVTYVNPVTGQSMGDWIKTRMDTKPISNVQFRHPLQGKPKGQDSQYSWLLSGLIMAVRVGAGVIAYDGVFAANIREEARFIAGGPPVFVITVNGEIFQWGMDSNKLMHIIGEAGPETRGRWVLVHPEDAGATRAPGQTEGEDTVMMPLECGHNVELEGMPKVRYKVPCPECRSLVWVTYWTSNEPVNKYRGENPYPYSHEPGIL